MGGTCYHDIETAELVNGALDDSSNLVLLANVALDGDGLDGKLGIVEALVDEVSGLLAGFEVDVGENDIGALGGKEDGAFTADTAVIHRKGDKRGVSGQSRVERNRQRERERERYSRAAAGDDSHLMDDSRADWTRLNSVSKS